MRAFFNAIGKHRFSFLSMPGVVSVGLGLKTTGNRRTGIPCLVFGVERKVPFQSIPKDQLIPPRLDSLPTDVVQTGRIRFLGYALPIPENPPGKSKDNRKAKIRPAQPGVSIGHYKVTAGTFGALVRGNFPHGIAILSNNHILANSSDGNDGLARPGDPVLQPGPYDEGTADDIIARLHSFSPIIPADNGGQSRLNRVDAALAVPVDKNVVQGSILGLGTVRYTDRAYPGMPVFKSGRSSGVTGGRVVTIGNTIKVDNDDRTYVFEDQIGTTAMSESGDSGALMVSRYGRAIALLFAGSDTNSFGNPINAVLDYFKVTL